jgi:hypothetical protein
MRHQLYRYSPEICAQLRRIAEQREWREWDKSVRGDEVLEDLELTYHLHVAAEANGARAGFPAMPTFPVGFIDSEGALDPVDFLNSFQARQGTPCAWNQSDNGSQTGLVA